MTFESCLYAATDKNTSDDFTLTLKLKKSSSSIILMFLNALSTRASGQGSLYFSNMSFSKDPALTPIRIAQSLFFCGRNYLSDFFYVSDIARINSQAFCAVFC